MTAHQSAALARPGWAGSRQHVRGEIFLARTGAVVDPMPNWPRWPMRPVVGRRARLAHAPNVQMAATKANLPTMTLFTTCSSCIGDPPAVTTNSYLLRYPSLHPRWRHRRRRRCRGWSHAPSHRSKWPWCRRLAVRPWSLRLPPLLRCSRQPTAE